MSAGLIVSASACTDDPHPPGAARSNTLYTAFLGNTPKHLDSTASFQSNEAPYTYAVYEPLYAYHYLQRPYRLVPRAATEVASPRYLDAQGHALAADAPAEAVAESVYDIPIRPGMLYAPHPAFAKDEHGAYRYHALTAAEVDGKRTPFDFAQYGTREVVADDFVYALKRQATPRILAPASSIFAEHVVGLRAYMDRIHAEDDRLRRRADVPARDQPFLDFRKFPLEGATAEGKYTLRIRILGRYPQWKFWLATTFLAPVAWEADKFYAQPGMAANGLSSDVWPVGSGPFMLTEFQQDRRLVLRRNPNYHGVPYPCEGMPGDREAGLLDDCGKRLPFLDALVFEAERDSAPLREKFLQGYLDVPELPRPDWGVEFLADARDSDAVRQRDAERGLQFPRSVEPASWYVGFNWLDPVVGAGDTPGRRVRNRKLRQALSIAIDWEEGYGRIFAERGGEAAHGPVPAGLFGSRHGTPGDFDPVTHTLVDGRVMRRSIDEARRLLAEAGYPGGRDAASGQPLVLNYDYQTALAPERRAEIDWMVRQFAKLGVQLAVRATDYNQFQHKMEVGSAQIYWWGWDADYPDAENFLMLLYGPNGKAKFQGENAANYVNPAYDRLYEQMRGLEDGPAKQQLIDAMVDIVRVDAPWSWGYFRAAAGAFQPWVRNARYGLFVNDRALYYRIDTAQRARLQAAWNRPVVWPLAVLAALVLLSVWFGRRVLRRHDGRAGMVVVSSAAAAGR